MIRKKDVIGGIRKMKKTLLAGMAAITLVTAQGSSVPQTAIASSQDAAFDLKGIKDDITSIKDDVVEKAKDFSTN
jgi:hypothetical protein